MQRYTFQLSVGNRISDTMDEQKENNKPQVNGEKDTPVKRALVNVSSPSSSSSDNSAVFRDSKVRSIAERIEQNIKELDKQSLADRKPLYTAEEEKKLLDRYTSFPKEKKEDHECRCINGYDDQNHEQCRQHDGPQPEGARHAVVKDVDVAGETVHDPTDGGRIKKRHGGTKNTKQHGGMERSGGVDESGQSQVGKHEEENPWK